MARLDETEIFPFGAHDDQVDAASLALEKLAWVQQPTSPDFGCLVLTPPWRR